MRDARDKGSLPLLEMRCRSSMTSITREFESEATGTKPDLISSLENNNNSSRGCNTQAVNYQY